MTTRDYNNLTVQGKDLAEAKVSEALAVFMAALDEAMSTGHFEERVRLCVMLAQMVRTGGMQLARNEPLQLGSGAPSSPAGLPSPDDFETQLAEIGRQLGGRSAKETLELVKRLFEPLTVLTPDELKSRTTVMTDVARGKIATVGGEIDQTEKNRLEQDLARLHRLADQILDPLKPLPDAERSTRRKAMIDIAENGVPTPTAVVSPATPAPDPALVQYKTAVDQLNGHLYKGRPPFGKDVWHVRDPDKLGAAAKAVFKPQDNKK